MHERPGLREKSRAALLVVVGENGTARACAGELLLAQIEIVAIGNTDVRPLPASRSPECC